MAPAVVQIPANAKAKGAKKAASAPKKSRAYPPYSEMINEAIVAMKERTGSSQIAIAKFIEEKQKPNLPSNFKKLLLVQLKKLVANGKLVKVKNSFKLPPKTPSVTDAKVQAKPKAKTQAPPRKKALAEPKPKKAAKTTAAKSSSEKTGNSGTVKTRRPVKKGALAEKKKMHVKGVKKPKSVKSPAKRAPASAKKSKK